MMRIAIISFLMLVLIAPAVRADRSVDYQIYDKVLKAFVDEEGKVDYKGLKSDPQNLNLFVDQIEKADLTGLTHQEKKTFWINAYNSITLKVVADAYPVKSIRSINFFLVWEIPRKVAGKRISLGNIEHKIVRPMGDPRIHFALNCASIGCPELPPEPFYPELLDDQLDLETREFINNPEKVRLDRDANILYHSEIFDWFAEDFLAEEPDIKSYIMKYINKYDREYLKSNDVELRAMKYNWDLNEQK